MGELRFTALVAGRELREAFRRRTVWLTGGALLLFSTGLLVVPDLIDDGSTTREVVVVGDESSDAVTAVAAELVRSGELVEIGIDVTVGVDRAAAEVAVRDGDVDLAVVLDESAATTGDGAVLFIVDAEDDQLLLAVAGRAVTSVATWQALTAAGLSPAEITGALATPPPTVQVLDSDRGARVGASLVVSLVMYVLLLVLTGQVASAVAVEKSNRVSEVLLAIVPARALLFGKVLGVGAIGLFTLACGAVPVVATAVAGGSVPDGLVTAVVGGSAWFVLGLALYLVTAAALGSMVARQEEAGSAVAPLSGLLIVAYLVAQGAPASTLTTVLAYVPFTSPVVMPSRIASGDSSPAEIVGSLLVGVVTVAVVIRLAAAVYRRAIVRTGRRLRLRDVLRS